MVVTISMARVYDATSGTPRALVDRLWPRGIRSTDPRVGTWYKQVAPTAELRDWYHADRDARFDEFCQHYAHELRAGDQAAALADLAQLAEAGDLELVSATRDLVHSHVPVIVAALDDIG